MFLYISIAVMMAVFPAPLYPKMPLTLSTFFIPFSTIVFIKSMQETAQYLCENIQNCKLSYQQSDEITLLRRSRPFTTTAAAVSSHELSIASILISFFVSVFSVILLHQSQL